MSISKGRPANSLQRPSLETTHQISCSMCFVRHNKFYSRTPAAYGMCLHPINIPYFQSIFQYGALFFQYFSFFCWWVIDWPIHWIRFEKLASGIELPLWNFHAGFIVDGITFSIKVISLLSSSIQCLCEQS